mgnify:CR=1 FL=1
MLTSVGAGAVSFTCTLPASDRRETSTFYLRMTPTRAVVTWLAHRLFPLVMDIRAAGLEHLPPTGPVVLASNHLTNFDVFPMQMVLPRPLFFMGKSELFHNPALGWLIRQLGAFPVRRGARDDWAIDYSAKVLAAGQLLGIFPEEMRSKGTGMRAAKTGAARLAIHANAPIVPLALTGTHRLFRAWYRSSPVTITLGAPLLPKHFDTPAALTDRLMFTIAQMLPPEYRGVYADQSQVHGP